MTGVHGREKRALPITVTPVQFVVFPLKKFMDNLGLSI